jgi:hypothetical protein
VEEAQDEVRAKVYMRMQFTTPFLNASPAQIVQMKNDISRRAEKAKMQDLKYRQSPDIVVKVVCRYRAELFFKISRKTKLVKLFAAWTDRMETGGNGGCGGGGGSGKKAGEPTRTSRLVNGVPGAPVASPSSTGSGANFIFTHSGRQVEAEQTPEEAGMEDGDEILAVELMDLTEGLRADASVSAEKTSLSRVNKSEEFGLTFYVILLGRERVPETKIEKVLD